MLYIFPLYKSSNYWAMFYFLFIVQDEWEKCLSLASSLSSSSCSFPWANVLVPWNYVGEKKLHGCHVVLFLDPLPSNVTVRDFRKQHWQFITLIIGGQQVRKLLGDAENRFRDWKTVLHEWQMLWENIQTFSAGKLYGYHLINILLMHKVPISRHVILQNFPTMFSPYLT